MEKAIGHPVDKDQPCLPNSTTSGKTKEHQMAVTFSINHPNFGSYEENYCDDISFGLLQGCRHLILFVC